jgi:ribosome-associated translation inhibitor RaiA
VVYKYFPNAVSSIVSLSKKNKIFNIIIVLHITKKMEFTAQSSGETAKLAFDSTLEKLSKQLRRYKRKIKNYKHNENSHKSNVLDAHFQIINEPSSSNFKKEQDNNDEPLIFAELNTEIEELTVVDALEKMKLGNISALMFRNKKHSGLNMIYKREDGLIGWVDPRGNRNLAKV